MALSFVLSAAPPVIAQNKPAGGWLGEELPLPLAVKTPQDLALKAAAERQFLIFNLMARGKQAWDAGDFAAAATKWEALLQLTGLDAEVARVMRPFATEARGRAQGNAARPLPVPPEPVAPPLTPTAPGPKTNSIARTTEVSGTVAGGGSIGPGGTVIWLRRLDASTPRPAPFKGRTINQINKTFVPRVMPVTVGTKVEFRNQDDIFHNVFSLSKPNDFDAGLYKNGQSYSRSFDKAGPVQILCNIHASMLAYVVVVDSPYLAQADASGAFSIKNLPPGEYELSAWHESARDTTRIRLAVGADGVRNLSVKLQSNRRPLSVVPDKYGKPRQAQLGY